jgi:histidinol-phosphatase (PHP family)
MHTHFCDGGEAPEKYVLTAIEKGLKSVGFSAHAPAPFDCNWALPANRLNRYIGEIEKLKAQYQTSIQIYLGLELDYFPDMVPYTNKLLNSWAFDYFIGSVHFIDFYPGGQRWTIDGPNEEFRKGFREIFSNDSEEVTRRFFAYNRKMIQDLKPPVIGHIDKLKMQYRPDCFIPENHPLFKEELVKTLDVAQKAGSIVEINTRALYKNRGQTFYPGQDMFKLMQEMNIKVMVNSDAHLPPEIVSEFGSAFNELRKVGYKSHWILIDGQFKEVELPANKYLQDLN